MSLVTIERQGAVADLILDRPEKRNAINRAMLADLVAACRDLEHAKGLRAVILRGRGAAFSAGGDIFEWGALGAEEFGRHWLREGNAAFDALARLALPTIAVIDGHALGGGLEIAACTDYRVAEEQVKFGQPETGLGIVPGWSGTQRAVRRFGAQTVRRMSVFGEVFDARQAMALGIVDMVVGTGGALEAARGVARRLTELSPRATEIAKLMVNHAEGEETGSVVDALAGAAAVASPDIAEGLAAFREKRKPRFGGDDQA